MRVPLRYIGVSQSPSEDLWQTRGVAKAFKPQFIKSLDGLGWMFMKFKIIWMVPVSKLVHDTSAVAMVDCQCLRSSQCHVHHEAQEPGRIIAETCWNWKQLSWLDLSCYILAHRLSKRLHTSQVNLDTFSWRKAVWQHLSILKLPHNLEGSTLSIYLYQSIYLYSISSDILILQPSASSNIEFLLQKRSRLHPFFSMTNGWLRDASKTIKTGFLTPWDFHCEKFLGMSFTGTRSSWQDRKSVV